MHVIDSSQRLERVKCGAAERQPAGTVAAMAGQGQEHDVTCPHCHKDFSGPVLGDGAHRGFKCPHCRLFVPYERVEEHRLAESRGA